MWGHGVRVVERENNLKRPLGSAQRVSKQPKVGQNGPKIAKIDIPPIHFNKAGYTAISRVRVGRGSNAQKIVEKAIFYESVTDQRTDGLTDRRTDGRTLPLIESLARD